MNRPDLPAFGELDRIDQVLSWHAGRTPDARCLSFDGAHSTYRQVDALVDRVSRGLARRGLQPGDRVAVLSPPRPEYLILMMGISRAGGIYVGLNPRYTPAEVAQVLTRVGPRLVASIGQFDGRASETLFSQAGELVRVPELLYFSSAAQCADAFDSAAGPQLAPACPVPDDRTAAALDRTASIVFTSGTTGQPKAAMLTHRGLLRAAWVQHERLNPPNPRYLSNLPINHVGEVMNLTLSCLIGAGSLVFQPRFSAAQALELLRDEQVTCWVQVPAMFHDCVNHPDYAPASLSHLRSVCAGGGALSARTLARLRETGARLFVEYGQTETSSSATYSDEGADDSVLLESIGRFDERFEFRIADDRLQACETGSVGEIQGRGELLFAGYFGDPQATAEAFTADGWLKTGDLALRRADGNIVLMGRSKEMIKSGGYNVYPRELEIILESHPAVSQVVVVGLPDERLGESVHAVLVLREAACRAESLDLHCRQTLAGYKLPKSYRCIDAFPLLPNGKLDRVRTRQLAGELAPLG